MASDVSEKECQVKCLHKYVDDCVAIEYNPTTRECYTFSKDNGCGLLAPHDNIIHIRRIICSMYISHSQLIPSAYCTLLSIL